MMIEQDNIPYWIAQLGHKKKTVRDEAATQLKRHQEKALPLLLFALENEYQNYLNRDVRLRRISSKLEVILFILGIVFVSVFLYTNQQVFLTPVVVVYLLVMLPIGIIAQTTSRSPKKLKALYNIIAEVKPPGMVKLILKMFATDCVWMSGNGLDLLSLHLPNTLPSLWNELSTEERKRFFSLLCGAATNKLKRCQDFALVALKALEQVGDAEAIPTVERIAKKGKSEKVREAAAQCLPFLQVRREEQTKRETLLRASEVTEGKEELLRVSPQATIAENAELLRVSE